jgi:hypothetical protein
MMRDFSSRDGMQSNIDPHTLPVWRPIVIILNAMMRAMLRSMLCVDGIPNNGIIKITKHDKKVR